MNTWRKSISVLVLGAITSLLLTNAQAQGVATALGGTRVAASKATAATPVDSAHLSLTTTDFSDGWWVPAESGWGVNILHQESVMALAFYLYDGNNQPVWYLGRASFVSAELGYQGTLSRSTGSGFGVVPYNPSAFTSTLVGSVSFRPTSIYDAVLTYNVGNTAITKNVTRIAFSAINYSGSFVGALAGTLSDCTTTSNGIFENLVLATSSVTNGNAQLVLQGNTFACALTGPLIQRGKLGSVPVGTYTCNNGSSGSATISEWDVNRSGMTARYTTQSGTCLESGRLGALRRD